MFKYDKILYCIGLSVYGKTVFQRRHAFYAFFHVSGQARGFGIYAVQTRTV